MEIEEIMKEIVDAAYKIHTRIGPGLLESVYEVVLAKALENRGLAVRRQVPVAIRYDGIHIEEGFKVDLLVENSVVVELKSVEKMAPVHAKQLLAADGPPPGTADQFRSAHPQGGNSSNRECLCPATGFPLSSSSRLCVFA